ncbi:hypothetical protein [Raoultella ornithinolytica]|nr:hypothetical protein [Raoultella ornithinolytica]
MAPTVACSSGQRSATGGAGLELGFPEVVQRSCPGLPVASNL